MRSYAESTIDPTTRDVFHKTVALLELIPDDYTPESGAMLSCHHVARLVGLMFDLKVTDGHFGRSQHSWIDLGGWILDPYPVGVMDGPLLVPKVWTTPFASFYTPSSPERPFVIPLEPVFNRDVAVLLEDVGTKFEYPVPKRMDCPRCGQPHLDVGEFETRIHRTHRCTGEAGNGPGCGFEWKPFRYATIGVESAA